ncbi:helix-turn-helix domain-containing protein, partial [Bacillus sp. S34]|nr:helix-turn-helix domain-containing protein [Bacillus sp. S34]
LSSVLPYALEMLALRRMPTRVFGVLQSLGPAIAALAGMSADYYTRLEQQRGPQPSEQMVAAIARALRCTLDERDHHEHEGERDSGVRVDLPLQVDLE